MSGASSWPYYLLLLDLLARESRWQRDDLIRAVQPDFDALLLGPEAADDDSREAVVEATVGRLADELLDENGRRSRFDHEAEKREAGAAARYVLRELLRDNEELRTAAVGQLTIGVLDGALTRSQATALVFRLRGEFFGMTSDDPALGWLLVESHGDEPS